MSASTTAYAHIITRLRASAALTAIVHDRIYQGVAPASPVYPLVLVQPYGSTEDVMFNGPTRAMTRVSVSVRVIDQADSLTHVEAASDAIDAALQASGPAENSRGFVAQCYRTSETELVDLVNGTQWRYLGGIYELLVTDGTGLRTFTGMATKKEQ